MRYRLFVRLHNGQLYYWRSYRSEQSAQQAMKDIYPNNKKLITDEYRVNGSLFKLNNTPSE